MIIIPKPCSANWERMPAVGDGNYCDKCCKVVVDFTSFSNEELITFFSEKRDEKICGHFRKNQVVLPKPRYRLSRFLAALVVVFGSFLFSSCGNHKEVQTVDGGPMMAYPPNYNYDSANKADSVVMDSMLKHNKVK